MHSSAGVVIHGTHGLLVADNVGFHVQGSCFYIEDGVEERNLLSRNLAAYVHVIGIPAAGVSQAGQLFKQACGGSCGCCLRVFEQTAVCM